jgi:hypothetical protein
MDNLVIYRMVEEIGLQCRLAEFAHQNIRASLSALNSEKTFFHVDAFLGNASNLTRLFWPARAESQARGEKLRGDLKIGDDSPLRLREIWSQLERFDEHLEDWLEPLENRNYVAMNIMPVGTMGDYKPDKFHRSLDPETLHYHFRGALCDLRKVAEEIRRLDTAAQTWLRTHNPW